MDETGGGVAAASAEGRGERRADGRAAGARGGVDRPARERGALRARLTWRRLPDAIALAVIGFVVFQLFIAPRLFAPAPVLAPTIRLASASGGTFSLAQHRGRVVFLDFWASWCEPCQRSLPLVEHFARTHPDVDVIAVNVGESPTVARRYAHEHDLGNVVFDPEERASSAFGLDGLPTMVVVDPAGYRRGTWPGYNPGIEAQMARAAVRFGGPSGAAKNRPTGVGTSRSGPPPAAAIGVTFR